MTFFSDLVIRETIQDNYDTTCFMLRTICGDMICSVTFHFILLPEVGSENWDKETEVLQ